MILIFNDSGWEVVTSAWTVAAKPGHFVEVCYSWSALSGMAWLDSATGVSKVGLNIKMEDFRAHLRKAGSGPLDLRDVSPAL